MPSDESTPTPDDRPELTDEEAYRLARDELHRMREERRTDPEPDEEPT